MLIDCDDCAMRGTSACDDCVVTFLVGDRPVDLTDAQAEAIHNLSEAGLVPDLRLIRNERRVS